MKLLALLMALGIERWRPLGRFVHRDAWFASIQSWMDHNVLEPSTRYFCAVVIPAIFIALMLCLFKKPLWGMLGFLLQVLLLLYVIGRGRLTQALENYLSDWRTNDLQGAAHHAQEHFMVVEDSVEDGVTLHHQMRKQILYYGLIDFFVVVFWYLILGVFGALVSCLTQLYVANAGGEAKAWAQKSKDVIEWLPARLLGLTFAVAGNFGTCFGEWVDRVMQPKMNNSVFLEACGMSAIGLTNIIEDDNIHNAETGELTRDYLHKAEQELRALLALIERSRYVWVAIVAVAIVLGWL